MLRNKLRSLGPLSMSLLLPVGCFADGGKGTSGTGDSATDETSDGTTQGSTATDSATSMTTSASGTTTAGTSESTGSTTDATSSSSTDPTMTSSSSGSEDETGVDATPPELVSGEFIGLHTVKLAFSEDLGPVANVMPTKFRMSWATSNGNTTTYHDLGSLSMTTVVVTGVTQLPNDPSVLQLELSANLTPAVCTAISNAENMGQTAGIIAHYTKLAMGGSGQVEDVAGNDLESMGQSWVNAAGNATLSQPGDFAEFGTTPIFIPC